MSDYDAWANVYGTHHYTKDMEHAAAGALNAGLDQEGGGVSAISHLAAAVQHGLTNATAVEHAFRRLMRMRVRLGMLDPPSLMPEYTKLGVSDLQTKTSTALNRRVASSGMVLLKNGDAGVARGAALGGGNPLLPLDAAELRGQKGAVLVAGATADNANNTFGNYACNPGNCTTYCYSPSPCDCFVWRRYLLSIYLSTPVSATIMY